MRRSVVLGVLIVFTVNLTALLAQVSLKDKTDVTVLKKHPERPKDATVELLAEEPKDRKYEVVCMISATGGQTIFNSKKGSDLFKKMEVDARKCGADALIIRSSESQTWKPLRGGIDQGARAQALAIKFVD